MPQDSQDDESKPALVGRVYHGEVSPPVTTPEAVAARLDRAADLAKSDGAVNINVYFVVRGIDNQILQASMLAYTEIRVATIQVFDEIFARHHGSETPKTEEK